MPCGLPQSFDVENNPAVKKGMETLKYWVFGSIYTNLLTSQRLLHFNIGLINLKNVL